MTPDPRHVAETFSGRRQMLAQSAHCLRSVHADVVESGIASEYSGQCKSTGEWTASQVHDNWLGVGRTAGKDSAESLGQLLQMAQLVVVGVEKDTFIGRQLAPWFVEICLTPTHDLTHCSFPVDTECCSGDGTRVVVHATGDLGASKAR